MNNDFIFSNLLNIQEYLIQIESSFKEENPNL
jgi:hypothetical protein